MEVGIAPVPRVRTFMLTDLVNARAARRAAVRALADHDPRAIIYCSVTAALLWPRPGAIWLDSIAADNRPRRHGVWQRAVERRRLAEAPLVMAMSAGAAELVDSHAREVIVVPVPVETVDGPPPERDIAAITYASGDAKKRRLELVLDAWSRARGEGEKLIVAGSDRLPPTVKIELLEGVELAGRLSPPAYQALLRRSRAFVAAPRREDYGIAPLEALAHGCMLVTTPASGPYPALSLARQLDPRLVSQHLDTALRAALDDPVPGYAKRATELLQPFTRQAVDHTVAEHVLPRLLDQRLP